MNTLEPLYSELSIKEYIFTIWRCSQIRSFAILIRNGGKFWDRKFTKERLIVLQ